MKNQECRVKPKIININNNNPILYPFSIQINKCGNCNTINNPYAKICVPDVIKDLNVKVLNLMSRTNKTRFIKWHEKCEFYSEPVYEYKYLKTKVRECNGEIKTNFLNNGMPKENINYSCIACVTIDSVINFSKKTFFTIRF